MNEDELYAEETESAPPAEAPAEEPPKEDSGEHTELVSKKLLGLESDDEIKPGHECTLTVVKDYGKEVEVRYSKKKKPTEDEELSMMAE